jgi:hypothetical protein
MKDNEIYLSSLLARQEHIHSEDPAHASPHGSRSNVHFTSNGNHIIYKNDQTKIASNSFSPIPNGTNPIHKPIKQTGV